MYEVKVVSEFSSSHRLRDYGGKCENVHGHNWNVELICRGENLNKVGLVIDFKELKQKLNAVLDTMDHKDLNEIDYFKKFNPSSENICYYIFMHLSRDTDLTGKVKIARINVWETDSSCASYYEGSGE